MLWAQRLLIISKSSCKWARMAEWTFADNTSGLVTGTGLGHQKRSKPTYPRHLSISKGTFTQPSHIQVFKDLHGHEGVHAGNVGLRSRGWDLWQHLGLEMPGLCVSLLLPQTEGSQVPNFKFLQLTRDAFHSNSRPYINATQNVLDFQIILYRCARGLVMSLKISPLRSWPLHLSAWAAW